VLLTERFLGLLVDIIYFINISIKAISVLKKEVKLEKANMKIFKGFRYKQGSNVASPTNQVDISRMNLEERTTMVQKLTKKGLTIISLGKKRGYIKINQFFGLPVINA
jgi:hypothetical protein